MVAVSGKPVFNFRSEGRSFAKSDRCLIPADGSYEFTKPEAPKQRRKDHLFTLAGEPLVLDSGPGEARRLRHADHLARSGHRPLPDRQIVVLPRAEGMDWLTLSKPEATILRPLPEGRLTHAQVR